MTVMTQLDRSGGASVARPAALLYVQAQGHVRAGLAERLSYGDLVPTVVADVAEALRQLAERPFACCLIDLANARAALTSLRLIRARHPALPVLGVVDAANAVAAAEAVQAGVVDVLPWPFTSAELVGVLEDVRDRAPAPPAAPETSVDRAGWFFGSPSMRAVAEAVRMAAGTRLGVAVCGERGSGRERVARAIHASGSAGAPFLAIECARQAPDELERVIFGDAGEHVSADAAVVQAKGGTLFIATIVELPARVQTRLARVLRDREGQTAAGEVFEIDVRLIVSLQDSPDAAVGDGRLRRELVDRLVTRIDVPALRDRRDDIPHLAVRLAREACVRHGMPPKAFSRSALALLGALPWPGNTLDLSDFADRVVRATASPVIQIDDVLGHANLDGLVPRVEVGGTLRDARMRFERDCISATLARHHGRVGEAAKALGIQRTNLYRKVRQLKVDKALLSPRRP